MILSPFWHSAQFLRRELKSAQEKNCEILRNEIVFLFIVIDPSQPRSIGLPQIPWLWCHCFAMPQRRTLTIKGLIRSTTFVFIFYQEIINNFLFHWWLLRLLVSIFFWIGYSEIHVSCILGKVFRSCWYMDLVEAELNKKTTVIYQNIVCFFFFVHSVWFNCKTLYHARDFFFQFFSLRAFNNGDKMIYYYDGTLKQ